MTENDPLDLLRDDQGDVVIPLQFARGVEGVKQLCQLAVLLVKGEWFLDLDAGVDYFGKLLGQKFDAVTARAEFRTALVAVPGVAAVELLEATFDSSTRTLNVNWRVRTIFGPTVADSQNLEV